MPTLLLRPNPKTLVCLHFRVKSGDITVFIYRLASGDTAASLHLSPETAASNCRAKSGDNETSIFTEKSGDTNLHLQGEVHAPYGNQSEVRDVPVSSYSAKS
jgi:hypothetical protein